MSQRAGHAELSRSAGAWLLALADPEGRAPLPAQPLPVEELAGLIEAAAAHGVLPAALRNLRRVFDTAEKAPPGWPETLAEGMAQGHAATGAKLMLMHQAGRIAAALKGKGLAWSFVKGPVFARLLYPAPGDRTFTDLDILADPADAPAIGRVLHGLGFAAPEDLASDAKEEKWVIATPATVMVEIQTDLVHSVQLGRSLTLPFAALAAAGGPESPAAQLLVAAAHGAGGHQFERLQQVVDLLQAARRLRPVDRADLAAGLERCNGGLALAAGLDLAAHTFADPAAIDLARCFSGGSRRRLARALLTPAATARAQSAAGGRDSWRRRAFRELLKRPPALVATL